jgi:hypothetical protein
VQWGKYQKSLLEQNSQSIFADKKRNFGLFAFEEKIKKLTPFIDLVGRKASCSFDTIVQN